jgi:hypothetical protein
MVRKGKLDLISDNEWVVQYRTKGPSGVIIHKSLPLSRFHKMMYKNQLYINAEIEFKITKENDHISHCKCSEEQYDNCEFFVKSGINDCLNYENVEIEVAKIISLPPKPNETFDRETVKKLLVEVKNRFAVMSNENYNSDLDVIEWFDRNHPKY